MSTYKLDDQTANGQPKEISSQSSSVKNITTSVVKVRQFPRTNITGS